MHFLAKKKTNSHILYVKCYKQHAFEWQHTLSIVIIQKYLHFKAEAG